ncbi:DUF2634 domain-containing protein [Paenibacillus sp. HB172176]|uniref:DUF2634 domain-containing protein n=1 Tax=Paenibacillus sp. HB172176 TaxID=2493690 RepID=UPI001439B470|nr:DUF2634 domain-containing protein [Paenibacillus sp. HB172176]
MIPAGGVLGKASVADERQPSLTWKLDFERGRVVGKLDGMEAIKQTIDQILQTQRYSYLIYSFNYGNELSRLIGMSPLFLRSEAARVIREALTQDDRIGDISDLQIVNAADRALISFTVLTELGAIDYEREVNAFV